MKYSLPAYAENDCLEDIDIVDIQLDFLESVLPKLSLFSSLLKCIAVVFLAIALLFARSLPVLFFVSSCLSLFFWGADALITFRITQYAAAHKYLLKSDRPFADLSAACLSSHYPYIRFNSTVLSIAWCYVPLFVVSLLTMAFLG